MATTKIHCYLDEQWLMSEAGEPVFRARVREKLTQRELVFVDMLGLFPEALATVYATALENRLELEAVFQPDDLSTALFVEGHLVKHDEDQIVMMMTPHSVVNIIEVMHEE